MKRCVENAEKPIRLCGFVIIDMFSQFDGGFPRTIVLLILVLLVSPVFILFSRHPFGIVRSVISLLVSKIPDNLKRSTLRRGILVAVFMMILFVNFLGIVPFAFRMRAHGWFVVGIALSIYLTYLFLFFLKNPARFFAHLVPMGSPRGLRLLLF